MLYWICNGYFLRKEEPALNLKNRLEAILPFVIVMMMLFYGCPLFMKDTGSSIVVMLAVMPAGAFLCSFFCGLKKGFSILYLALVALSFIPEYWFFLHDWEALGFYLLMYTVIAVIGMFLGWGIARIVKRMME